MFENNSYLMEIFAIRRIICIKKNLSEAKFPKNYYLLLERFFTSVLADGLLLEFE